MIDTARTPRAMSSAKSRTVSALYCLKLIGQQCVGARCGDGLLAQAAAQGIEQHGAPAQLAQHVCKVRGYGIGAAQAEQEDRFGRAQQVDGASQILLACDAVQRFERGDTFGDEAAQHRLRLVAATPRPVTLEAPDAVLVGRRETRHQAQAENLLHFGKAAVAQRAGEADDGRGLHAGAPGDLRHRAQRHLGRVLQRELGDVLQAVGQARMPGGDVRSELFISVGAVSIGLSAQLAFGHRMNRPFYFTLVNRMVILRSKSNENCRHTDPEGDPMTKSRITRRGALKASLMTATLAGTASFFGPWKHNRVWAQGKKPIKLGLTCDASGQFGNSGQDDLRGMRLAIDEFNAKGGVLGRKIEWITADTETNPAAGTRIAERFIAQEQCGFLIGALHSGVANAITQVANKYGTIYMNTNSSAPSEAGENCSRVKFVWDGNGTNFSKAAVANAVQKIGKKWLLLTNDYVWGHTTSAATKAEVEKAGGQIVDNLLVPQNTRDFTSYLLKVQQIKPDVIATAIGGDDIKALRQQMSELKLEDKAAWINNQQDWPDIWGVPETLFGVFGTTWYHMLKLPGVPEFVKRWQTTYPQSPIPVPGNVSYNGYMATRELLRAIEQHRLDQQHRPHQGAGRPQDERRRPHAELRCLDRSGHPSGAADDLPRQAQPQAGGQVPTCSRS